MPSIRHVLAAAAASAAIAPVAGAVASSSTTSRAVSTHSLVHSRVLWATVDVCNAPDQPDYVGIRGSMPGDGRARDRMFMSFRIQYLDTATRRWVNLQHGVDAEWVPVGNGASARQGGTSFQLMPVAGSSFTLRGVVHFRWRRGKSVVASATRVTTGGHRGVADADPAGFSAASCRIG
jgi:hypothetical protein